MIITTLVAGIGGDHFYQTDRTFWRNIGEPYYNHRLEDINSLEMTRRNNKKLKGFHVKFLILFRYSLDISQGATTMGINPKSISFSLIHEQLFSLNIVLMVDGVNL